MSAGTSKEAGRLRAIHEAETMGLRAIHNRETTGQTGANTPFGQEGQRFPQVRGEAPAEEMPRVGPKLVPRDVEPTVSIVIPTKNEARNLPYVLSRLPDDYEVIVVDGNSTDDTVGVAQRLRPDITVIRQTRGGKGNALACGFAAATGDFIVMIDADGSNDPAEIPRFVTALKEGADFAKGSRFLSGGGSLDISLIRRCGNFWLNKIVNLIYGTRYTDLCYGYNAFRRACLDVMRLNAPEIEGSEPGVMLWGDGFEVETLDQRADRQSRSSGDRGSELRVLPSLRGEQPQRLLRRNASAEDHPRREQGCAERSRDFQTLGTKDGSFVGPVVHTQRRGCLTEPQPGN